MKITVVTVFPEMLEQALRYGVLGSGIEKGLLSVECVNPRSFTEDNHKTVDDRPFGGGDGMLMLAEPLEKLLQSFPTDIERKTIYLSPQGQPLTHEKVLQLSQEKNLVLLCGRYGGVDQRLLNKYVDEEISIGDYVLSGGELAALVIVDAVSRQIPGVLGHQESAQKDSFYEGLLECPAFTRPREWKGQSVPEVLTSGNHAKIEEWRFKVSCLITYKKRPDVFKKFVESYIPKSKKSLPLPQQLQKFWRDELSPEDRKTLGLGDWECDL